jgi:hypothetical protein
MPNLSDDALREIADALRHRVARYAPEWTDRSGGDPGVALLELFAFIAESLSASQDRISEEAYIASIELTRAALRLARISPTSGAGRLERNRYFSGRLLSPEDFATDQDYFRERCRRLNRELHGTGIARGLGVSVESDGSSHKLVVQPGFALDPNGEEIQVGTAVTVCLPDKGDALWAILIHRERPTRPAPASEGEALQFTRIEEGFAIRLETAPDERGLALAWLLRDGAGWRKDENFTPLRLGRVRS